jgi:hypothetical protein
VIKNIQSWIKNISVLKEKPFYAAWKLKYDDKIKTKSILNL